MHSGPFRMTGRGDRSEDGGHRNEDAGVVLVLARVFKSSPSLARQFREDRQEHTTQASRFWGPPTVIRSRSYLIIPAVYIKPPNCPRSID